MNLLNRIKILLTATLLCSAWTYCLAEKLVEIKLKQSPRLFGNALPKNTDKIPNLPEGWKEIRKESFMAPAGTKLLSLNKKVTHNDPDPILIGDPKQITDGDNEGTDGTYVEFGPGLKFIQIDLEAEHNLSAIVIWHKVYYEIYFDVVVQVCRESEFKKGVTTLFNNDHDNSSGLSKGKDDCYMCGFTGKIVEAKQTKARFVRIYSNGSTRSPMNHFTEVEVYGK